MLNDVRTILSRPSATVAEDALGVATLFVLLIVGLNLPFFA